MARTQPLGAPLVLVVRRARAFWVLSFAALLTTGCSLSPGQPSNDGKPGSRKPKQPNAQLEVTGYANLRGRVAYRGDTPPSVKMIRPDRHQDECLREVSAQGWYAEPTNKGLRHVLVFVRAPEGHDALLQHAAAAKDPEPRDSEKLPDPAVITTVACQFEPRVTCLHPQQELRIANESRHTINPGSAPTDALINPGFNILLPAGKTHTVRFRPDDKGPHHIRCNCCEWMSAYVWKLSHPYGAVTDVRGRYELRDVPVVRGPEKLRLWVWHEMLPGDHFKEIGPLDLRPEKANNKDFSFTIDFTIPK